MDEQTAQNQTNQNQDVVVQVGKYKVQVLRDQCISAASCVAFSPSTFELDNEKKAVVKPESQDTPENILLAAQSCPTKAIVVTDAESGEKVWPK